MLQPWDFGLVFGLAILAVYVAGVGGFLPVGAFLLGKGKPEAVGVQTFFTGLFQFLCLAFLFAIAMTITDPALVGVQTLYTVVALNVAVLSIIWMSLGITLMRGWALGSMGVHLLASVLVFLVLAVWWAWNAPIIGTGGYLTAMNASYAITVGLTAAFIAGKFKSAKALAYVFIIFGIVTVLIPSMWLFFGLLP